ATAPADAARFHNDMDRAFADIDQALERFLEVRTSIGARLKTIETQQEVNADLKLQLQATRSKLEDIDLAEAVSLLARESNALQAAQAAFVRVQGLSLFNFL
ncbi:MAG: flagellar hook-associated protein 3, partial [Proteobacteria bacterium]